VRGFSLVEVLVVVAVVAILAALIAPALYGAREAGREAVAAGAAARHAAIISTYCADFRDSFPFFTDPLGGVVTIACSTAVIREAHFFDSPVRWNVALADSYYDGDCAGPFAARGRRSQTVGNTWRYPVAFTTLAAFWDESTRAAPPAQFGGTALSQVEHPSKKALVVEDLLDWMPGEPTAGFVDGHAGVIASFDAMNDAPVMPISLVYPRWAMPVTWLHHFGTTRHGIKGRDIR